MMSFSLLLAAAIAAGSEPAANPGPLDPGQERVSFQFADPGLIAELVASEPQIMSPVALAWDERGFLYVAEMSDYPAGTAKGKIKRLEDRNGDGFYESATTFAEDLPFPNGVLPYNGGLLVTAAPNIWFLKDTDGDGKADERRIVLTGFAEGNQQLRVNGLYWGLDNWIHGANGRSDGEVRFPDFAGSWSLRGFDFRFRPEGSFEYEAGRSQFGLGHDDWGNRFLSWNTIPIRHDAIPMRYLLREPQIPAGAGTIDLLEPGDTGRIFPISPAPRTFNSESSEYFNALAGLHIYRGGAMGPAYRGNAFAGETLRNMIHRRVLETSGATFVARRGEKEKEFMASTDSWFHPVNFTTGPDDSLYVADFYRQFVEHPQFVPETLRNAVDWSTGFQHGRIWRIRNPRVAVRALPKDLATASGVDLARHLDHGHAWVRDTVQRLLVERHDRQAGAAVERIALGSADPVHRAQAWWTLAGLGNLAEANVLKALKDPEPLVRVQALRLAESLTPNPALQREIITQAKADDIRLRFQAALVLSDYRGADKIAALAGIATRDSRDPLAGTAVCVSSGPETGSLLNTLNEQDPSWFNASPNESGRLLYQLAVIVGARNGADVRAIAERVRTMPASDLRLVLLAGLEQGLNRANQSMRTIVPAENWTSLVDVAARHAADSGSPAFIRLCAIEALRLAPVEVKEQKLRPLLREKARPEEHLTALRLLAETGRTEFLSDAFASWPVLSRESQRFIVQTASRVPAFAPSLVSALESGAIQPIELDPASRQALLQQKDPGLKERIDKILQSGIASDRESVINSFKPALQKSGDRQKGALIFGRSCVVCHSIQAQGGKVGPDLSGIAARPPEALLVDILDPSRTVAADFIAYNLVRNSGDDLSGFIVSETSEAVTLRRPNEPDATIPRGEIRQLKASGKSLMPEGLEAAWSQQDLADLIAFLRQPDRALIPK